MKRILIRGGRVIDPAAGTDDTLDVLIDDGRIAEVAGSIEADDVSTTVDADGRIVAPGLVDIHVHLREPGNEDAETIESGSRAAVHGGVTTVAAMPNTEPPIDTASWVEFVASRKAAARVLPVAAITVGRRGENLTEMAELRTAGAVAFSDDGCSVLNAALMRRALDYARMVGVPVVSHCEDPALSGNGTANEGLSSTRAGLKPVPAAAEEVMVARDLILAGTTGARLHVAHVSTAGSVELVRRAKADGLPVTCETCPHYFSLTDEEVLTYDSSVRVNPPLRSRTDVEAIREGLRDGTIDAIASDHAPHTHEDKEVEFDAAPPGMIGLETLLPVTLTNLVDGGVLDLPAALALLTHRPAGILGLPHGTLAVGSEADVCIVDPTTSRTIEASWFRSKSKNSPWIGRKLRGTVTTTICRGEIVSAENGGDTGADPSASPGRGRKLAVHA
ncbi:MAG: amidohydrolase family protein [Candidatus Eisenbacteria bacterium]|nr:amidohydrolase family protein [Candidatus Eisenbacteria bacterium]